MQKAAERGKKRRGRGQRGVAAEFRPELGDPLGHVQVAQPAGRFLHVRLQVKQRVLILFVPRACQLAQVPRQLRALFHQERGQLAFELREHLAVPRQKPPVEQADVELDVLLVHLQALADRAHGMTQPHSRVPFPAHEFRQRFLDRGHHRLAFDQNHDVDVGVGKQLAPAIAAHRQHGDAHGERGPQRGLESLDRHPVDGRREAAVNRRRVAGLLEPFADLPPGRAGMQFIVMSGPGALNSFHRVSHLPSIAHGGGRRVQNISMRSIEIIYGNRARRRRGPAHAIP